MKFKQWVGLFLAVLILFMCSVNLYWLKNKEKDEDKKQSFWSLLLGESEIKSPGEIDEQYYAQLDVIGTMVSSAGPFDSGVCDCSVLVDLIDGLITDGNNLGICLNVDSPGGEAYAADVLYLKLLEYKEKTGRPIVAYFNSMSASGGYYVSCAADYIVSQRSSWIGSIGVYVQITDTTSLEKKIGLNRYLIRSDENKGMGASFVKVTKEQKKIYQGLVDDAFEQFMGVVQEGRSNLSKKTIRRLADGRVYTAKQSMEEGLIDEIGSFEAATNKLKQLSSVEDAEVIKMNETDDINSLFANVVSQINPENNEQNDSTAGLEQELIQSLLEKKGSVVMYYAK